MTHVRRWLRVCTSTHYMCAGVLFMKQFPTCWWLSLFYCGRIKLVERKKRHFSYYVPALKECSRRAYAVQNFNALSHSTQRSLLIVIGAYWHCRASASERVECENRTRSVAPIWDWVWKVVSFREVNVRFSIILGVIELLRCFKEVYFFLRELAMRSTITFADGRDAVKPNNQTVFYYLPRCMDWLMNIQSWSHCQIPTTIFCLIIKSYWKFYNN